MRARRRKLHSPKGERGSAFSWVAAVVIHDAALLAAVFYAPIYWGGFRSAGQSFAACLIGIALTAALVTRVAQGRRLSVIPNAINLPTVAFLAISGLSALFSVSAHASRLELSRLTIGAFLFALVANRAAMPAVSPKPVAALFALFALPVPFLRVPGEAGVPLDVLTILAAALVCTVMLSRSLPAAPLTGPPLGRTALPPARTELDTPRSLWLAAVAVAAFVIALVGLREKALAHFVLRNPTWRIFATFFNPNPLGGFFAMMAPLAVSASVAAAVRWQRLTWGFAAFLLLLALVPTYSKGAAVALVVAMVVYLVLMAKTGANPRRKLGIVLLAFAAIAALAMAAVIASPGLRNRLSGTLGPRSVSNMFRLLTWKGTVHMAADHPWLGIGPGAFKHAFPKYAIAGYVEAAHENYLQILAEQGVFGAAVFLWLVGAVLFTGRQAVARAPDGGARALAVGAIASITVLLVHSLFDYDWYVGAINLNFWLLAGLLAHHAHGRRAEMAAEGSLEALRGRPSEPERAFGVRKDRRSRAGSPQPPAAPRGPMSGRGYVAACALVAVALGTIVVSVRSGLAERALDSGNSAVAAAQGALASQDVAALYASRADALRYFRAAVDYDPGWPVALQQLGLLISGAEGERLLKRAAALEPTEFQWRAALGRYYDTGDDWKQAIEYYGQALERFPNSTRILRRMAEAYQKLGDDDAALRIYRRMVEIEHSPYQRYRALDVDVDTEFAYAHYHLGRAAERGGRAEDWQRALHEFQEALRVIGDYQFRGRRTDEMFAAVGRPREPRAEELKALEAMTRWRTAEVCQRLGDAKAASVHRELALSLLPDVAQAVTSEDEGKAP